MSKIVRNQKLYDFFICVALLAAVVALCMFPQESVQAAKDGLTLCANVIIPSLFPFFVLSNMTVSLGLVRYFGKLLEPLMRPLFNVRGECAAAVVLGFIGGYPVGAKTALNLYENGNCTKAEAERLLSFCNNSGPAFILGVVGAGIFSSSRIGLMLYLTHFLASMIVGVIFRGWGGGRAGSSKKVDPSFKAVRFTQSFIDAVLNAVQSTINICGFVIFFTVFIRLLFLSGVLPGLASVLGQMFSVVGFDSDWAEMLLTGIIEISSGVWSLKGAAVRSAVAMAAFMLGWAGLSVHCQTLSFIGASDLSCRSYILGKILHGGISAALIFFTTRLFPLEAPVSAYLVEQVTDIVSLDFGAAITISTVAAACLWGIFLALSIFYIKKGGNRRRGRL